MEALRLLFVQQVALMTLGINDPAEVIDALSKEVGEETGENKEALLIYQRAVLCQLERRVEQVGVPLRGTDCPS